MAEHYILALDQGTTSSRSLVVDKKGAIIGQAQKEFKQIFPQPGWVEHDANEIWSTQFGTMAEAMAQAGINTKQVSGIGITNQRETTVVWDKISGQPIYHAIVWQDRRTAAYCDELKAAGLAGLIQEKTGLIIDAYFSATKLKWILDHVPGARDKAVKGELAFGTIDSWLTWKLTNGDVHVTDVSNASRTMLFNIHSLQWDVELLRIFDIPPAVLPVVKPSSKIYGVTGQIIPDSRIPVAGIAGDQQAALFGQLCTQPGMVKNTYGTGCFMLMNTGENAITSKNNLLTTIAWQINDKTEYALEGSVFIAGAVVQWLRDGLQIIKSANDIEALANTVPNTNGVYIVPAFTGLGAPYWNQHATGTIIGITRGTNAAHFALAALHSIAYQTMDVLKAMEADANIKIKELRVDGGATINNTLMQFQSNVLQCKVIRPNITETTALGAAYLAGLAIGYWESIDDIKNQWQAESQFTPQKTEKEIKQLVDGWNKAISTTLHAAT